MQQLSTDARHTSELRLVDLEEAGELSYLNLARFVMNSWYTEHQGCREALHD